MEYTITIGRRKASIARVYIKEGNGAILINGKDYKTYFQLSTNICRDLVKGWISELFVVRPSLQLSKK